MLVCDLGRGYLPWKLRAGHKLGTWAGPLLELLLSLRPLGTAEAQGSIWLLQKHLDVGVLNQAELLLDLVEFFLLPPDVGLQDACPLLQLVFDGLEHAELC